VETRGGARRRGYDSAWDKAAAIFKARHPWCRGCAALGQRRTTEVVDHVEPHKGDQIKFWMTSMWQPACRWHHDVIKPRLERMFADGEISRSDLWLDSAAAQRLARRHPAKLTIGEDGWPVDPEGEGGRKSGGQGAPDRQGHSDAKSRN
jgi:5-methylcytosine-specific restriction protein A